MATKEEIEVAVNAHWNYYRRLRGRSDDKRFKLDQLTPEEQIAAIREALNKDFAGAMGAAIDAVDALRNTEK